MQCLLNNDAGFDSESYLAPPDSLQPISHSFTWEVGILTNKNKYSLAEITLVELTVGFTRYWPEKCEMIVGKWLSDPAESAN